MYVYQKNCSISMLFRYKQALQPKHLEYVQKCASVAGIQHSMIVLCRHLFMLLKMILDFFLVLQMQNLPPLPEVCQPYRNPSCKDCPNSAASILKTVQTRWCRVLTSFNSFNNA